MAADPPVSIIVLNYDGREHLEPCFRSLLALTYPAERLELVLADNGSRDDSVAFMARVFPGIHVHVLDRNYGFCGAYNRAVAAVESELVVLLNNDTRVEPDWLTKLVACWRRHAPGCAAVGSAMLTWDGRKIDFGGARLNFHGFGFSTGHGQPHSPDALGDERPIPFACGGAMLVEREAFLDAGGFDEDYFIYFDDVDMGWRLWLAGREVWFAPDALTYHHEHGYMGRRPPLERAKRLELNALRNMVKNLEPATLERALPAALELAVRRATCEAAGAVAALKPEGAPPERIEGAALASLLAVDALAAEWPVLMQKRARVQAMRRRSDAELFAAFGDAWLTPARQEPAYVTTHRNVVAAQGLDQLMGVKAPPLTTVPSHRTRLLIICHDIIGPKMASSAMRHWELARALAAHIDVTLAAPGEPGRTPEGFRLVGYRRADAASLAAEIQAADVIFTYTFMLHELPVLATAGKPMALDLASPYLLEALEQWHDRPLEDQQRDLDEFVTALNSQIRAGDFYVALSERTRRFWLGVLAACGRVNPATFDDDNSLRRLIDCVPFGMAAQPPQRTHPVLKGVHPGIGPDDRVILWEGGTWNWFDPLTLLQALARVVPAHPEIKLFFTGASHFDPGVIPTQTMAARTVALARELGLLDRHAFFGDWVPYDERGNYLLEADLGASLHFDHLETHFAMRTRLVDYFWAGLPVLCTRGDVLSEIVAREGLGRVVAPEDVDGVAAAIVELFADRDLRARLAPAFARVRTDFLWERVAAPLLAFCRTPHAAADAGERAAGEPDTFTPVPPPWWRLPVRAFEYLRAGGIRYAWQGVRLYARYARTALQLRLAGGRRSRP